MLLECVRGGTRLLGPGPAREEALGSRMREEGVPGLPCSVRGKELSGVVAQSRGFSQSYATRNRELGGLLYQQVSWDPVLLSQLLKTGPCKWIRSGRELGLLSQDQVIELFVLGM